MKTSFSSICVFAIFAILFCGCQSAPAPLSESEKEEIIKEVRAAFDKSTLAVNNHDPDKIMEFDWNDGDYMYASDGTLTKGWEANFKIVSTIHLNQNNQSSTINYDEIIIKVLKPDAVMLVGKGLIENILTEDGPKSIGIVVTYLIEKLDDKWVVTIGHESSAEALIIL
jgi:ketosteroid isomerase-like protein